MEDHSREETSFLIRRIVVAVDTLKLFFGEPWRFRSTLMWTVEEEFTNIKNIDWLFYSGPAQY